MSLVGTFECFVLILLLMVGVWLTVRLDFLPFRHPVRLLREMADGIFEKRKGGAGFSAFEAAATSLAGTMGTGNIAGVASALALGGPGAVLWMILGALAGMCTKYAEIILGLHYRQRGADGEYRGGPMYYLSAGGRKVWAVIFAVLCALCGLGAGNMVQVNAAAQAVNTVLEQSIPGWVTGAVMAFVCLIVISGGTGRLGRVTAFLMPVLSLGYLAGCGWAVFQCREQLPEVLREIFEGAFGLRAAASGAVGYGMLHAVRYGLARGVFSHEAGLGSAPIAHAGADCESPHRQGLWGIFEVFWDTVVGCTATALVLLLAMRQPEWSVSSEFGGDWAASAFSIWFGEGGSWFVSASLVLFAAAAMVSWWLYGSRAVEYLTGGSGTAERVYLLLFLAFSVAGGVVQGETVWALADILNCCMAIPNLLALVWLFPKETPKNRR